MSYNYNRSRLAQANRHIANPFRGLGPLNAAMKESLGQYKNEWVFDHLTNQQISFLKQFAASNNKERVAFAMSEVKAMGKQTINAKFPNRVNRTKTQSELNANRARRKQKQNDQRAWNERARASRGPTFQFMMNGHH